MLHTLSFYGSVTTGARVTLVSKRIGMPYVVTGIRVKYALGHVGTVQHSFFISDDPEAPTAGIPSGTNLLAQYGSVDYVVGDDDVSDIQDNTIMDRMGTWVKVHAYNTDTATHTINVLITIDDLRPHPAMTHLLTLLEKLTGAQVPRV